MGNNGITIIIPDVHQNYRFIEKILNENDPAGIDRFLFLGDFFDAKDTFFSTVDALDKTLKLVSEMISCYREKVILILGNHDVVYFFNRDQSGVNLPARTELHRYYGIPDRKKMTLVRSLDLSEFWETFQLAHFEQGYLFSHAGVTLDHWSKRLPVMDNVDNLNLLIGSLVNDHDELNVLFRAGFSRGGDLERGGPLWLDWNREFTEEIGIPQIVGHTVGSNWRKAGRSYCLDAQQKCYGILREGKLEIKTV